MNRALTARKSAIGEGPTADPGIISLFEFLLALRNVVQARGVSKVAAKSNLNRESLYKMLSKRGNPSLQSLGALLGSMGFRLTVESKDAA